MFLDTPGIHRPLHRMNVRMVDAALDTIREVDVLGLVVDVAEKLRQGRPVTCSTWCKDVKVPVFLILNKIDLMKKVEAAAADRAASAEKRQLRRDRPGVGRDRRQRRPAGAADHRPAARGRAAATRATT